MQSVLELDRICHNDYRIVEEFEMSRRSGRVRGPQNRSVVTWRSPPSCQFMHESEAPMNRTGRQFRWHLSGTVVLLAILGIVAPIGAQTPAVGRACPFQLSKDYGNGYGMYYISTCNSAGTETSTSGQYPITNPDHLHHCNGTCPNPPKCPCWKVYTTLRTICLDGELIEQIYLDPGLKKGFEKFPDDEGEYQGSTQIGKSIVVTFKKAGENSPAHVARLRILSWKSAGQPVKTLAFGFEADPKAARPDLDENDKPAEGLVKYQDQAYYVLKYDGQLYHVFTQK